MFEPGEALIEQQPTKFSENKIAQINDKVNAYIRRVDETNEEAAERITSDVAEIAWEKQYKLTGNIMQTIAEAGEFARNYVTSNQAPEGTHIDTGKDYQETWDPNLRLLHFKNQYEKEQMGVSGEKVPSLELMERADQVARVVVAIDKEVFLG